VSSGAKALDFQGGLKSELKLRPLKNVYEMSSFDARVWLPLGRGLGSRVFLFWSDFVEFVRINEPMERRECRTSLRERAGAASGAPTGKNSTAAVLYGWCPGEDSNLHGLATTTT
jgi:hypothetical protein